MKKMIVTVIGCIIVNSVVLAGIEEGLIAKWDLDGNAVDTSGNGHDGVVHGASPTTDRHGNPNGAMHFDGNDYLSVSDSPDFTLGADDFTMGAWLKRDSFGADGAFYMLGHSNGPGIRDKWIFLVSSSNIYYINSQGGWSHVADYAFQLDTWNHVALRRQGNVLAAFVDGSEVGSIAFPYTIPDPYTALTIGTAEFDRPNRYLRGSMDEVRLYDRALSDSEMMALVPEPATLLLFGLGSLTCLRKNVRFII